METAAAPVTFDFTMQPLDWAVIGTYLVGIVLLGVWFGKFTKNTNDFFLADSGSVGGWAASRAWRR